MGAYTWTFVRIDKVTKEQTKSLVEYALHSGQHTTYGEYSKLTEEEYIPKWINMHKKNYDYFVNECGVSPEKLTDEYLTKEIKSKMKKWFYTRECYQKVLNGDMTFEEMIKKTHQLTDRNFLSDFYITKHKGHYFVNLKSEIFRNYEYCDEKFDTVDALIEHCRNHQGAHFLDFAKEYDDYREWNDEIEQHVRKYYEAIGDGNFVVHFG